MQHTITTLHPDDRRKADKLKKKKRRKEREHSAGEESEVQQAHPTVPGLPHPVSFGGQAIKEEPEDDISIPLHPQHLPSPATCKEEPKEEHRHWDGQDIEEGVVKVQKVEGFAGNRTVFRQGKQVVFRDEDGSGEDEDIMVDSGKVILTPTYITLLQVWQSDQAEHALSCLVRWRLVGPGDVFLQEAFRRSSHDRVQQVSHLDSPVVRQDPQEPRARDICVPELPRVRRDPGHPPLPPLTSSPQ